MGAETISSTGLAERI